MVIPAAAHAGQPPIISIPTDGANPASRAGLLSLMQTLHGIREQLRSLENQAEIENHNISRLRAQQQAFFADFDRQLRQLNGGGHAGALEPDAPQSPPGAASGGNAAQAPGHSGGAQGDSGVIVIPPEAGPVVVPPQSASAPMAQAASSATVPALSVTTGKSGEGQARAAYDHAFNLLRAGRYQHSVLAFQSFLQAYPHNQRAAQAQYWVAETDYVEREYPKAEIAFKTLVARYPESKKVPNALLKMGYIAKWQGHPNKARSTWQRLVTQYPKSMAAQVARNSLTNLGPGTSKPAH
ncbi:MAG: tol-pal system protein YbgF [Acidiferrobacter sp.]